MFRAGPVVQVDVFGIEEDETGLVDGWSTLSRSSRRAQKTTDRGARGQPVRQVGRLHAASNADSSRLAPSPRHVRRETVGILDAHQRRRNSAMPFDVVFPCADRHSLRKDSDAGTVKAAALRRSMHSCALKRPRFWRRRSPHKGRVCLLNRDLRLGTNRSESARQ